MRRLWFPAAWAASLVIASAAHAQYDDDGYNGPFAQGRVQISVGGGTARTFDDTYLVLGAGAGYYVLDGLQVGLDAESWLLGDPTLYKVSPQVRYVFYFVPGVQPYIGTFYRHLFISKFDDLDSIGGRAGLYYVPNPSSFIGLGVVHERYLSCDDNIYDSCSLTYPEFALAFSF